MCLDKSDFGVHVCRLPLAALPCVAVKSAPFPGVG